MKYSSCEKPYIWYSNGRKLMFMVQMVQYNKDIFREFLCAHLVFLLAQLYTVFTTDGTTKEASSQTDDKSLRLEVEIALPLLIAVVIIISIIGVICYKR